MDDADAYLQQLLELIGKPDPSANSQLSPALRPRAAARRGISVGSEPVPQPYHYPVYRLDSQNQGKS
jgi:hypothetical protein